MGLDIRTTTITIAIISLLAAIFSFWAGIRSIQSGRGTVYYRIRHEREVSGWRLMLLAFILVIISAVSGFFGEPIIYTVYQPSPIPTTTPTITLTPTISLTPTITQTPTITLTPAISYTPTPTTTPFIPMSILAQFESSITPNPNAAFSPLEFSDRIANGQAVNPKNVFFNPVGHVYSVFSYNNMISGSQWTALWLYQGELVHFETLPWDGVEGGWGYSDWDPSPELWKPGEYTVQIFVGEVFKVESSFTVEGSPLGSISATPTIQPDLFTQSPTVTP
ncbi:hypothetical protein ACFLXB_03515 [Chloroflexota bacterium]